MRTAPPRQLFIAYLTFIAEGIPAGALNAAWIHRQTSFGLSLDALGVLLLVQTTGRLLVSFNSGRLIGWLGMGPFLLISSITLAGGLLGYALAPSWFALVAVGFVFGAGYAGLNAAINTFVAAHYSASRMNWLHAWFGVGSTIGPLVIVVMVLNWGLDWRWSYAAMFAIQLALTVVFAFTLGSWGDAPRAARRASAVSARATLRLPAVWLGIGLFFFHAGTQVGAGQLSNSLFVDGRGIDPAVAGVWISIFWASLTAGRFFSGMVVDRIANSVFLRFNMAGTALGALLMWWNPADAVSFFGLALMGFTLAPVFATLVSDTPGRVGAAHAPNTIGFEVAAAGLGAAILPGLAGAAAEGAGLELIGPFLTGVAIFTFLLHEFAVAHERRAAVAAQSA